MRTSRKSAGAPASSGVAAEQRRARAGRDRERLGGRAGGGVAGAVLLDQREVLGVGEQVERVVGAGAVGAEPDRDPVALRRAAGRRSPPTASFMFATGLVTIVAPRGGDQLALVVVEPDGVGEQRPRAEQPDAIEQLDRPDAVRGEAVVDLALGLGDVDLDRDAEPLGLRRRSTRSDSGETV